MNTQGGVELYSATVLNLDSRWRWVVSFTPLPNCSRGNSPRYPFDRRLGGTASQSGRYEEDKKYLAPAGIEPTIPGRPARSVVAMPTELSHYILFMVYLLVLSGSSEYIASSGNLIKERWVLKDSEGILKMNVENDEKPRPGESISRPRFEPGISRTQVWSVIA
jgi:hypothetical protein